MTGPVVSEGRGPRPQVGIGWPLLPQPDAEGRLNWPSQAQSVRQRIEAILRTAPGEQLMRPRFGAGLETLIDEPNTLVTRAVAHDAIVAALNAYEDRIILDDVSVDEGADARLLRVGIAYRLRLTGEPARIEATIAVGGA